jgi:hypothetical protein
MSSEFDRKISAHPDVANPLDGTEILLVNQDGVTGKTTLADVAALVGAVAIPDGSITTAKFAPGAKAPLAGTADLATLATNATNAVNATTATTAGSATTAGAASVAALATAVDTDGVDTNAIQDDAVTTPKIADLAVTEGKLASDLWEKLFGAQPLTLVNESSAPGNTYSLLVATDNDGVIALGTAGKFAKFNWSTFTWTESVVSGPATINYAWASYIAGSDLIWAGNNTVVHAIDPTTMAATAITGATGALVDAAYNAVTDMVYGYLASVDVVKEMDKTTGVVARTFTDVRATGGWYSLACHPVTGDIVVVANNDGTGDAWFVIPAVAFSAATRISVPGQALGASGPGRDRVAIDPVANVAVLGFESHAVMYRLDLDALTGTFFDSRDSAGGGAVYQPTTEHLYLNHGASRLLISRVDSDTPYLDAVVARTVPITAGHTVTHMVAGVDGYLHMLNATSGRLMKVKA